MSSNYNPNHNTRRGGGGGGRGGGGNRGGGRRNRGRWPGGANKAGNWRDEDGDGVAMGTDNNSTAANKDNQQQNNNVAIVTEQQPQSSTNPEVITINSSSEDSSDNNSSGDGTAIFATADEGEEDEADLSSNTVQEISSEEDVDEPPSVVNASLIVNLSSAGNVTISEDADVASNEVLIVGESPVKSGISSSSDSTTTPSGSPRKQADVVKVVVTPPEPAAMVDDEICNHVVAMETNTDNKPSDESVNEPHDHKPSPSKHKSSPSPKHKSPSKPNPDRDEDADDDATASEEDSTLDSEVEKLMMGKIGKQDVVEGLPSTVTVLRAPNGVVVYLVGTAHFSQQSQVDVANTIQMTQPTIVLLELCSSRKNILDLDEETVLREVSEMNFQKVRLALSNSGAVQGTLHLLLLSMSAQLTKNLGMAPGGEFRVATREGRKIPGVVILLGDRPFNITISRALAALSFYQKIKLAWQFLTCNEDITPEEIEKCKEKDLLERMLTEMTGEFPSITEVFVNERDVYLAHSLYLAATSEAHRNNGGPVVGVVGMGHVSGIVRNWGKTSDRMVDEIIRIPETPLSTIIIRKSIKLVTYALLGYGVYRIGRRVTGGRIGGGVPDGLKKMFGGVRISSLY